MKITFLIFPKPFFVFRSLLAGILMKTEQTRHKQEKHISHLLGPFLRFAKIRKDVCIAGSEGNLTSNACRQS